MFGQLEWITHLAEERLGCTESYIITALNQCVTWSWEISRRGGFSEEDLYITREEDLARRIYTSWHHEGGGFSEEDLYITREEDLATPVVCF